MNKLTNTQKKILIRLIVYPIILGGWTIWLIWKS